MHPVSPAIAAPSEKASSLSRLTGIPISSAASGSSRRARHDRPIRERESDQSAAATTTSAPSENQKYSRVECPSSQPKNSNGSMSASPFAPPVIPPGFALFTNVTNAWPKKSVTIAR